MERTIRWPGSRAAEYERDHPGTVICQVEGVWRATVNLEAGFGEYHDRTEDGLIDRLTAGGAGG